jgi:hypothetical protein
MRRTIDAQRGSPILFGSTKPIAKARIKPKLMRISEKRLSHPSKKAFFTKKPIMDAV